MTQQQILVRDWMKIADQSIPESPTIPKDSVCNLRIRLIAEELAELAEAMGYVFRFSLTYGPAKPDLVLIADALSDLDYVTKGTWVACGLDDEPFFNEVHRSNCTKFVTNSSGKLSVIKSKYGKVLKPDSYSPPDLLPILNNQMPPPNEPHV